jgi:adenylylsulfate kinase
MKDSRIRSVAKGLSWRAIATGTTMSLVYLATGDLEVVAHVGMADVVLKLLFYYGHERAWGRVVWGRAVMRGD